MIRLVTYNSATNVIDKVILSDSESSIDINKVGSLLFEGESTSITELRMELKARNLSIFMDVGYESESTEISLSDYKGSYEYELNITPNKDLGCTEVTRLQFHSTKFDDEEINELLAVPAIRDILNSDSEFSKLVNQVNILDADWKVLLSYLTEYYGYEFKFIFYYPNEEDSNNI